MSSHLRMDIAMLGLGDYYILLICTLLLLIQRVVGSLRLCPLGVDYMPFLSLYHVCYICAIYITPCGYICAISHLAFYNPTGYNKGVKRENKKRGNPMKIEIRIATNLFVIRSLFEVKQPLQKQKSPAQPKPQPSISNTISIINHN